MFQLREAILILPGSGAARAPSDGAWGGGRGGRREAQTYDDIRALRLYPRTHARSCVPA
jgi:hypothetical protein